MTGGKGRGSVVCAFLNVRRIKEGIEKWRQVGEIWRGGKQVQADFIGLSDTGTEEGIGKGGKYDRHSSCGRLFQQASREWGGGNMTVAHSVGRRGRRGGGSEGLVEGCVWQGAHERMQARTGRVFSDSRGWGRYTGMEVGGG